MSSNTQYILTTLAGGVGVLAALFGAYYLLLKLTQRGRGGATKLVATDPDDPFTLWSVPTDEDGSPKTSAARGCLNVLLTIMMLGASFICWNVLQPSILYTTNIVFSLILAIGPPLAVTIPFALWVRRVGKRQQ